MTTAIPTSPAELEEMLKDKTVLAKVSEEGKLGDLVSAYARTVLDKDKDIAVQVREQAQLVMAEWLKEHQEDPADHPRLLDLRPGIKPKGGAAGGRAGFPTALYNPRAMGADKSIRDLYADQGNQVASFFQDIWHQSFSGNASPEARKRIAALQAYSESVPSEGGFMVPEVMRSELLQVALEESVVRPLATVIPMESLRVSVPKVDSTTNVGSVFGGVQTFWVEEGGDLPESEASFGTTTLDAKKLIAYAEAKNELVRDWSAFGAWIGASMPRALAFSEDLAFQGGTGVGEPLGMLTPGNTALVVVDPEAGQSSSTILWQNVVSMFARMMPQSLSRAVWIASVDTFRELATMALSVGTGGAPVWLNNGVEGPPMRLLGRPVYLSEKTPGPLGAAGDLSFVDPSFYLVGDRQAMTAESSEHYKFKSDRTVYRVIQRVDGRPWLDSAIEPANGGPALSPFVQLAARP